MGESERRNVADGDETLMAAAELDELHCSFCDKTKRDEGVESVIAGPNVFICDVCVEIFVASFAETQKERSSPEDRSQRQEQPRISGLNNDMPDRCSFCRKHEDQVGSMQHGPSPHSICRECIDICVDILAIDLDEALAELEDVSDLKTEGEDPTGSSILEEAMKELHEKLLSTPEGRKAHLDLAELMNDPSQLEKVRREVAEAEAADPDGLIAAASRKKWKTPEQRMADRFAEKEKEVKQRLYKRRFRESDPKNLVSLELTGTFRLARVEIEKDRSGVTAPEPLSAAVVAAYNAALTRAEEELGAKASDPQAFAAGLTLDDLKELRSGFGPRMLDPWIIGRLNLD